MRSEGFFRPGCRSAYRSTKVDLNLTVSLDVKNVGEGRGAIVAVVLISSYKG